MHLSDFRFGFYIIEKYISCLSALSNKRKKTSFFYMTLNDNNTKIRTNRISDAGRGKRISDF